MTNSQSERYARHLLLPEFGPSAQERLLESKVLVIGAGGLGSPALLYLTAAGVGHITIIDHDTVDLSNLQRQILHSERTVGTKKIESAEQSLRALNSDVTLSTVDAPFTIDNALTLVQEHDLVIDGSDNFATRFLTNDACYFSKTPLVYGSIFQYEGQLSFFNARDKHSPCYRCLVPAPPEEGAVPNCLEAGVIGTLPGIIGSMQAMEAIKYLAGVGTPPIGKMLYYDALNTSFRSINIQKDPQCPLCSAHATINTLKSESSQTCTMTDIPQITCENLKPILEKEEILLIDVREAHEYAQSRIPGSQLFPLSNIEHNYPDVPKDQEIFVHCAAGIRSMKAIEILMSKGFTNLINVQDGIQGWR